MNDTAEPAAFPFLFKDREGIGFGFPSVNRDWKPALASHSQLFSKSSTLHLARRVVVMIIQPDLAPRDHLRVLRKIFQLRINIIIEQARFVRMNSDGCVNERILLGDSKGSGV